MTSSAGGLLLPPAPGSLERSRDSSRSCTLTRAHLGTDVKGVAGFTPQETQVTGLDKALTAGRWFNSGDTYAAITPQKRRRPACKCSRGDVGKVTVNFSGVPYLVIGIVDPDKFKGIKDLDNESLTPVDYQAQQNAGQFASGGAGGSAASSQAGLSGIFAPGPGQCPVRSLQHIDQHGRRFALGRDQHGRGGNCRHGTEKSDAAPGPEPVCGRERPEPSFFGHRGHIFSQGLVNIIIPILIAALDRL